MRRLKYTLTMVVVAAIAVAAVTASAKSVKSPQVTACGPALTVFPSPNAGKGDNTLTEITAVPGSNELWAVGFYWEEVKKVKKPKGKKPQAKTLQQSGWRTLIQHFDGKSWKITPSPNPGADNLLFAVSFSSSRNGWAVGKYTVPDKRTDYKRSQSGYVSKTLTLHWDGKEWKVVPAPSPGEDNNELYSVVALSDDDVWAGGNFYTRYGYEDLPTAIIRWDGRSWKLVSVPPAPPEVKDDRTNYLRGGVVALSSQDVWIAGSTKALHWDGNGISWFATPTPGTIYNSPFSISAASSTEIWISGYWTNNARQIQNGLLFRWDGVSWQDVNPQSDILQEVLALGGGRIVALEGYQQGPDNSNRGSPVVVSWDGKTLTSGLVILKQFPFAQETKKLLRDDSLYYGLFGLAASPDKKTVWVAGYRYDKKLKTRQTLVMRVCPV